MDNINELILEKLKINDMTPVKIAYLYKIALKSGKLNSNWREINDAICEKWDFTTLEHIKHLASLSRRNNIYERIKKLIS